MDTLHLPFQTIFYVCILLSWTFANAQELKDVSANDPLTILRNVEDVILKSTEYSSEFQQALEKHHQLMLQDDITSEEYTDVYEKRNNQLDENSMLKYSVQMRMIRGLLRQGKHAAGEEILKQIPVDKLDVLPYEKFYFLLYLLKLFLNLN